MKAAGKWQGPATLGTISALVLGVAALTPGAMAAPTVHSCANKTETLEIASGEPGGAPTMFKVTVKAISIQGGGCTTAYKFIGLVEHNKTTKTPEKYKCTAGASAHFKVPSGYVPEVCTKGSVKIRFAQQGG
jgi:hypothetical protein